jgi:hypothetical protein
MVAALWLWQPALASEDSGENPFPDGFDFDKIEDIQPTEETAPAAPSTPVEKSVPVPKASEAQALDLSGNSIPQPKVPAKSQVTAAGRIINTPGKENITVPGQNNIRQEDLAPQQTLTDTLKADGGNNLLEGTWVEKLTSSNPLSLLTSDDDSDSASDKNNDSLEGMVKNSRNKQDNTKSNAAVFDISGVMLRMSLKQAERTLENRGFRKINAKFQIPNFIKWRNEEICRTEGVVGYERLEACVIDKAKKQKHQYLQYVKYAKFDSKEEIEVYFTSNFTENKVYKIVYESRIADITGNSPKAVYIRNIKVYDFWKKISQKYGTPDDKTTVVWGMGGDKAYLKASTGHLVLEDPMFRELDYTRMSREDQRFINSEFYNF